MKGALCKAFCDMIEVRRVPAGLAVSTAFQLTDGDPVLFYVVGSGSSCHLEDDGTQIPNLEATGVDLGSGTRAAAFGQLLEEYGLSLDSEQRVLRTGEMSEDRVPIAALQFIAALLRLQDFALLSTHLVRSTFKDDAIAAIQDRFQGRATVSESTIIDKRIGGFAADVLVEAERVPPLAVFLGTSDEKALQALVLKMEAEKYQSIDCRVVLLVERAKANPLREPTYALAQARLDHVLAFRDVEADALNTIERLAFAQA